MPLAHGFDGGTTILLMALFLCIDYFPYILGTLFAGIGVIGVYLFFKKGRS